MSCWGWGDLISASYFWNFGAPEIVGWEEIRDPHYSPSWLVMFRKWFYTEVVGLVFPFVSICILSIWHVHYRHHLCYFVAGVMLPCCCCFSFGVRKLSITQQARSSRYAAWYVMIMWCGWWRVPQTDTRYHAGYRRGSCDTDPLCQVISKNKIISVMTGWKVDISGQNNRIRWFLAPVFSSPEISISSFPLVMGMIIFSASKIPVKKN